MLLSAIDISNISLWKVALAGPVSIFVGCLLERLWLDIKLSKTRGVRAPIIANNLLTSLLTALYAVYMQTQNRLLEFFNHILSFGTPACPNTVELYFAGRRLIITKEPEHIKTVLTTKFGEYGKGESFHRTWSPFLGDSIFTTDGKLWQNSRSLIRPMFVKDRVRDLEIFDRGVHTLIAQLPPTGQTVDLCDLFYRMTLDVTTEFLLGHSVQSLQNPKSEFSRAFTDVQRLQMILTIIIPFDVLIPKGNYNRGIKILERFMNPFIEQTLAMTPEQLERLSKDDKEFTFLHNIALYSRDPKVIRDQIMAVLLAGRDTTASTLSWTLYELANYPHVWKKLRETVLDKVGPTGTPSYDDIKSMTYLSHALNETLRLYPAVPYNIRFALENSTLPGQPGQPDITCMKGDHIIYSTLAMQRRRDLYPTVSETFADPATYSPERWEHWTPKPWQYVPFNGGPRICIGQNFALTEMAFVMVRLLQRYERIEYRGDWSAQFHKAEIVGCPGQGVPVALYEAKAE